ncbi:hypothetical protein GRAN_4487 [Granulicella sibirica]|uniref:Uncharacterized protein n=1 Tax=Granulicella sibirica TaxID=2479048 RepID=A0A4Q0SWC6_9BACT|nr:hypothetical protein GRAN_4487 [Granulicella sibirica]
MRTVTGPRNGARSDSRHVDLSEIAKEGKWFYESGSIFKLDRHLERGKR